jgi:hypothetical protein
LGAELRIAGDIEQMANAALGIDPRSGNFSLALLGSWYMEQALDFSDPFGKAWRSIKAIGNDFVVGFRAMYNDDHQTAGGTLIPAIVNTALLVDAADTALSSPIPTVIKAPRAPIVIDVAEQALPNPIRQAAALDEWNRYLGPDQTNIHPRTGIPDPNRIVSADGTRSIRFGEHEMNSPRLHYHLEGWGYDPDPDLPVLMITNDVRNVNR